MPGGRSRPINVRMAENDKKAGARRQRLAAALRENLKRRKAQARGRKEPGSRPQTPVSKKPDS